MSKDLNDCKFTGRLTRDPEINVFGDSKVANFSIAVNDEYTKDGEKMNNVTFVELEAWNAPVKFLEEYCKKGDFILVSTQYRQTSKDTEGETKRYHKFRVNNVQKLSWDKPASEAEPKKRGRKPKDVVPQEEESENDLPF
jgi:single-strand DNA-binding protein